jgi:hypothetical protein
MLAVGAATRSVEVFYIVAAGRRFHTGLNICRCNHQFSPNGGNRADRFSRLFAAPGSSNSNINNELDLSDEKRWGEPLDKNFARVLSENISKLLNTQQIEKYPWPVRTHIDYQIEVDVQRFETTSDGKSQLIARWIVKDGAGKDLYASETTASTPVSAGETGASSALSNDLATLSREVAARITELRQTQSASSASEKPNVDRHLATM